MSKQAIALLFLKELEKVERTDLKPYCIELVTRDKSYYISMKNDEELYSWMDEIYLVSPLDAFVLPNALSHSKLALPPRNLYPNKLFP